MRFLINSKKFNYISDILFRPLLVLSLIFLVLGLIFDFFLSPEDYQQGSTVRIMYVHVPSAWLSLMTYLIMTIYSIIALSFRMPFGFIVNTAVAPIGAIFTLICIISGSLWGKPMWGTWWVWDARLTSVLILFFLYIGFITLYHSFDDRSRGAKAASILALVGAINLPIIKFSVDWWNTLHQPASVVKLSGPAIHTSMLTPLFVMAFAYICFYFWILIIRLKATSNLTKIRAFEARQINIEREMD